MTATTSTSRAAGRSCGHAPVVEDGAAADDLVVVRSATRPHHTISVHRILPIVDGFAVGIGVGSVPNRALACLYLSSVLLTFTASSLYRPRIAIGLSDDWFRILGGVALPLVAIAMLGASDAATDGLIATLPGVVAAIFVCRAATALVVRRMRTSGRWADATLIVGAGEVGIEIALTLVEHPEYGLFPVGFIDGPHDGLLPLPMVGNITELNTVLTNHGVTKVIVAFGSTREPDMVPIFRACDRWDVDVFVVPRLFDLGVVPGGGNMECLWGLPLIRVRHAATTPAARRTKRCFDVTVSAAVLLLTMPLFGMLAIAIRCSSGKPVLFRQKRVGQGGRIFEILKFRTLPVNGDSDNTWSVATDARVTRIGRLLRRTSLDELPQLVNVLRGDMSLVGPRPERPTFVDQFALSYPQYFDRHRLPVGMTGWAQIHGLRGDTSIADRVRFDNYYIEQWSLWRDVTILIRSIGTVCSGIRGRHGIIRSTRRGAGGGQCGGPYQRPDG